MLDLRHNKAGQATTELAIMGSIVIMLIAYLLQQGFIYNSRQALEMYTFRKALQLSRDQERGINLTVMRDVKTPSFFSSINRQRLMASSSVEYNPWKLWLTVDDKDHEDPEDTPSRQLLQINDAMIRKGYFVEIPPTRVVINGEKNWVSSAVSEIDAQTGRKIAGSLQTLPKISESQYYNRTEMQEDAVNKTITKYLASIESDSVGIRFDDKQRLIDNYQKEDWEGKITNVSIGYSDTNTTIPKDIDLDLEEKIVVEKTTTTLHPEIRRID